MAPIHAAAFTKKPLWSRVMRVAPAHDGGNEQSFAYEICLPKGIAAAAGPPNVLFEGTAAVFFKCTEQQRRYLQNVKCNYPPEICGES